MFGKTSLVALMIIGTGGAAMAQTPTKLDQFDYWGAYAYKADNRTVCYVLSTPVAKEPATVNHGDNFFLVSRRDGTDTAFEPQFMAGYNLREASHVTVSVGDRDFSLFTRETSAWVETARGEADLVAAMRAGSTMTVKAVSHRGTHTSYTYSLKGISAALNSVRTCK